MGEVDLRYIGFDSEPAPTDFDELFVGVTLDQFRHWPALVRRGRPVELPGHPGCIGRRLINALVTDSVTAQRLLAHRD